MSSADFLQVLVMGTASRGVGFKVAPIFHNAEPVLDEGHSQVQQDPAQVIFEAALVVFD